MTVKTASILVIMQCNECDACVFFFVVPAFVGQLDNKIIREGTSVSLNCLN